MNLKRTLAAAALAATAVLGSASAAAAATTPAHVPAVSGVYYHS